jgi:hypothetical protein
MDPRVNLMLAGEAGEAVDLDLGLEHLVPPEDLVEMPVSPL